MLRILAIFLLLTSFCVAAPWTQTKTTWKHSNGLSVSFPLEFQAQAEDALLKVSGKQGFMAFTVQGIKGEKEFKSWVRGNQQAIDEEGLKVKSDQNRQMTSGLLGRFMEVERTSETGILFVIVYAAFQKGPNYLCMQLYYPKEREADWTPLLQKVVNSVK